MSKSLMASEWKANVAEGLPPMTPRPKAKAEVVWLEACGLRLDLRTNVVETQNGKVRLTKRPARLLRYLMENQGEVCTYAAILREVWGTDYTEDVNTVHVHISWLRKAVGKHLIHTVKDAGYVLSDSWITFIVKPPRRRHKIDRWPTSELRRAVRRFVAERGYRGAYTYTRWRAQKMTASPDEILPAADPIRNRFGTWPKALEKVA